MFNVPQKNNEDLAEQASLLRKHQAITTRRFGRSH
jgi:hypothetical protein